MLSELRLVFRLLDFVIVELRHYRRTRAIGTSGSNKPLLFRNL